jgi:hypothetical protein
MRETWPEFADVEKLGKNSGMLRRPVLYPTELRARAMDDADLERRASAGSDEDVRAQGGLPPL